MALLSSKSFSGVSGKLHHKAKSISTHTLPRKAKVKSPPSTENHIAEISVSEYRSVVTDPKNNDKRRAILVHKQEDGSLGFTLQTYGLYHPGGQLEVWTYVDYVAHDGPAKRAGMRPGDVIISVNGEPTDTADHRTIVDMIRSVPDRVRMVVLFQDCVRKVQLHQKLLKLKRLLDAKERQLAALNEQEARILEVYDNSGSSTDASLEEPESPHVAGLRRSKLTGSLPLLPSYPPKLNKSASVIDTNAAVAAARVRSPSAPQGLGSEIKLLDPVTIATVGGCPSPQTMRRYPASPSFGNRKGLRRHGAIKKDSSPRLGVKKRSERYSSDLSGEGVQPTSDSDDDDAFVSFSARITPPPSPRKWQSWKIGQADYQFSLSPLVKKDILVRECATLGVPKVLTVLTPRSKTPEPRLESQSSPVLVVRPNSPIILERVPSQPFELAESTTASDTEVVVQQKPADDDVIQDSDVSNSSVSVTNPDIHISQSDEMTNL